MSGDGGSICGLGLFVGSDGWVTCHHYEGKTPILVIDAGGTSFSIGLKGRDADEAAVEFARALLRNAQEFAADIEQLHTEQHTSADSANADSSGADGDKNTAEARRPEHARRGGWSWNLQPPPFLPWSAEP